MPSPHHYSCVLSNWDGPVYPGQCTCPDRLTTRNRSDQIAMIELTADELGALLTDAARLGLETGRAGTEGDYTAEGIAGHVYIEFIQEKAKNPNG